MPVALKKKHLAVVEAPVPVDPLRAALAAAIEARCKADRRVITKREAVSLSTEAIAKAETRLEAAQAGIAKAKEHDVRRAAAGIANRQSPATSTMTRQALAEVTEAERSLEVSIEARKQLEQHLSEAEDDAARAHNEVLISVKRITQPAAQKILDETATLKRRVSVNRHVLGLLTATEHWNEEPKFSDRHSLASMKAQQQRDSVLHEIREQTESLFFGNSVDSSAVEQAVAAWREALTALHTNSETALPT